MANSELRHTSKHGRTVYLVVDFLAIADRMQGRGSSSQENSASSATTEQYVPKSKR